MGVSYKILANILMVLLNWPSTCDIIDEYYCVLGRFMTRLQTHLGYNIFLRLFNTEES